MSNNAYYPVETEVHPLNSTEYFDDEPPQRSTRTAKGPAFEQTSEPGLKSRLVFVAVGLLAVVAAYASNVYGRKVTVYKSARDPRFRKPDQSPQLEKVSEIMVQRTAPKMWFPNTIIRANRERPDAVYANGSEVYLSPDDSMFYQWEMRYAKLKPRSLCYIEALVPAPDSELAISAGKTFVGSGDLGAIQIWNVTRQDKLSTTLSWDDRPERVNLLGTVNFTHVEPEIDGWQLFPPTPIFACADEEVVTVEVTCERCTLSFKQIFSFPPLAFDLQELR